MCLHALLRWTLSVRLKVNPHKLSSFTQASGSTKQEPGWKHSAVPLAFITGTQDECAYRADYHRDVTGRKLSGISSCFLLSVCIAVLLTFSLPFSRQLKSQIRNLSAQTVSASDILRANHHLHRLPSSLSPLRTPSGKYHQSYFSPNKDLFRCSVCIMSLVLAILISTHHWKLYLIWWGCVRDQKVSSCDSHAHAHYTCLLWLYLD